MAKKVKGDDKTQYLVIVAKVDLERLADDPDAEMMDGVDIEFKEDEDGYETEEVEAMYFDESYASAELDEKLQELFGKGLVGGYAHTVQRGDYLFAAADRTKNKDAIKRFLRDKLGMWS